MSHANSNFYSGFNPVLNFLSKKGIFLLILIFFSIAHTLSQNIHDTLNVDSTKAVQLETIEILSDRIIDRSSVSDLSLVPASIRVSQGLYEDPLRSISFFPGVSKGTGDLFSPSQIYVRGGNPDENLYMLDNVRIFFPWYFGGIKSIYNVETIDKLDLLTGGFSAKYGNAMSSILNVGSRNGSYEKYSGNLSVGFVNSQATFEGPLIKNKVSLLFSVRKTYLDLFIKSPKLFPLNSFTDGTYIFCWKVNNKHKVMFSGLSGINRTTFHTSNPTPGTAGTIENKGTIHNQSLQWQAIFKNNIYSKLSLIHSFSRSNAVVGENFKLSLNGENLGLRQDFSWYLRPGYKLIFGGEYLITDYNSSGNTPVDPFELDPSDTNTVLYSYIVSSTNRTSGAYTSLLGKTGRFNYNVGCRYDYNRVNFRTDISPRVSLSFNLTNQIILRAAWGHYSQFPALEALQKNNKLISPLCTHYILGCSYSSENKFNVWIEAFNKIYENLVVYDSLLNYANNGSGFSRGLEFFVAKKNGPLVGWISYAFSISKRREPLQKDLHYFAFDQRHVFNSVLELNINNKNKFYVPHQLSLTFTLRSGNPYTPVDSAILTQSGWRQVKGEAFSARNPAYHNLTFKIQFRYNLEPGST